MVEPELPHGALPWTVQHGASDLSFLPWLDVPLFEFGPPGGGHHGPDENLDLDGARAYTGHLVAWLVRNGLRPDAVTGSA